VTSDAGTTMAELLLNVRDLHAGYGRAEVLRGLTLTARAGTPLDEIARVAAAERQWLALDGAPTGTIGATVATASAGPLASAFGTARDHVLGCAVVTGRGVVVRAGGRVVKNVAGYDLSKLFTGSFGTLGVIAELNFKLRPRPECERTVIVDGPTTELPAKARSIISAGLFPVAAEILSPAFAAIIGIATTMPVMLVRFAGNEASVKYQVERTLALSDGGEVIIEDAQLWKQIAAAPMQYSSGWYAGVLPSEVAAICKTIDVAEAIWQIGAADGRIRMLDDKVRNPVTDRGNARFLLDRVKQQLDPTNKFGVYQ